MVAARTVLVPAITQIATFVITINLNIDQTGPSKFSRINS
ncbi:MAG: hypothetical protein ACI901_001377 [Octadecabacter sp.]